MILVKGEENEFLRIYTKQNGELVIALLGVCSLRLFNIENRSISLVLGVWKIIFLAATSSSLDVPVLV